MKREEMAVPEPFWHEVPDYYILNELWEHSDDREEMCNESLRWCDIDRSNTGTWISIEEVEEFQH